MAVGCGTVLRPTGEEGWGRSEVSSRFVPRGAALLKEPVPPPPFGAFGCTTSPSVLIQGFPSPSPIGIPHHSFVNEGITSINSQSSLTNFSTILTEPHQPLPDLPGSSSPLAL